MEMEDAIRDVLGVLNVFVYAGSIFHFFVTDTKVPMPFYMFHSFILLSFVIIILQRPDGLGFMLAVAGAFIFCTIGTLMLMVVTIFTQPHLFWELGIFTWCIVLQIINPINFVIPMLVSQHFKEKPKTTTKFEV